ncbi:hypothetical protein PR202_gb29118 [Eleusine coracana subsp. coracana]|uniref:Uncharacterized protein n=1 Tax=Eleusine coracana subsp. coracana TaxID=191504 RepID=A0AAV5G0J6_ELECO|nr:hypothetical protein PR202_gb29118 [Eleusine coracana subsp. coracana]
MVCSKEVNLCLGGDQKMRTRLWSLGQLPPVLLHAGQLLHAAARAGRQGRVGTRRAGLGWSQAFVLHARHATVERRHAGLGWPRGALGRRGGVRVGSAAFLSGGEKGGGMAMGTRSGGDGATRAQGLMHR